MNVSATLDGEVVNIVNVTGENKRVFITYVNSTNDLVTKQKPFGYVSGGYLDNVTIASGASIV